MGTMIRPVWGRVLAGMLIGLAVGICAVALRPATAASSPPAAATTPAPAVVRALPTTGDWADPVRTTFAAWGMDRPPNQLASWGWVVRTGVTTPDQFTRPAPPPREITIAATGDLLIHTPVWQAAAAQVEGHGFDFAPLLGDLRGLIGGADLGVCHLEVPLTADHSQLSSYPIFNAPAELADGVAAVGWDACSTASNHSADQGFDGLVETLEHLDAAGLAHAGTARSPEEAATPTLVDAGPATIGLVSATYGLNGLPQPAGEPWTVDLIDPDAITADARLAREAGADLVLASIHFGEEYQHTPTAYQQDVAAAVMAGGQVDAIIGHHAHVVQPVALVEGRPVAFGLGNLLSGQTSREVTRDGVVLLVTASEDPNRREWTVTEIDWVPTQVERGSYRVRLADEASRARTDAVMGRELGPRPLLIPAAPAPAG